MRTPRRLILRREKEHFYCPFNKRIFLIAADAAIVGMVTGRCKATQRDYKIVAAVAGAFAEAFDNAWNASYPAEINSDTKYITKVVIDEFSGRGSELLIRRTYQRSADWIPVVAVLISLIDYLNRTP
jgi:hypothetical protein